MASVCLLKGSAPCSMQFQFHATVLSVVFLQRGNNSCRKEMVAECMVGVLQGRVVRLPVHLHELMAKVTKVDLEYQAEHGHRAGKEKLAELVGISTEKLAMLSKVRTTTIPSMSQCTDCKSHKCFHCYYSTSELHVVLSSSLL